MSRRIAPPRLARPLRSPTAVAAGTVLVLALATPAGAEGEEIIIRPTTVIIGAPGTVHTVADMPVAPSLVGKPCDLRVVTQNQSSVHPGTDVMVSTGSARSVIEGVEDSPDGRVVDTHRVTLGDDILVEVMIGPDGATSLGFTLSFECSPDQLLPTVAPSQQTTTTVAGGPTTGPTVSAPLTGDSTTSTASTASTASTVPGPEVGGATTSSSAGGSTTAPLSSVVPNPAGLAASTTSTTAAVPAVAPLTAVPSVLGAQLTAPLPKAQPARATTGNPSFTG